MPIFWLMVWRFSRLGAMRAESERLDDLIVRLRTMPAADRKAILGRMQLDQRYAIEQLLRARKPEAEADASPAAPKRYTLFSPVLARMLGEIDDGGQPQLANGQKITEATCAALKHCADTIREASEKEKSNKPTSFMAMLRSLVAPEVR